MHHRLGRGGAVAAKELAEAGLNTIVLEQGGLLPRRIFDPEAD